MTDIQTLAILLSQNERHRDTALVGLQRARATAEAARAQAEQLHAYRRDHEVRWGAQFAREGKMEVVHCYQSFTERLTLALEQQSSVVEHTLMQVEYALSVLREAEMRCASVRKLIERRIAEHRFATERRDQKQTDEAASRAAWNGLGSTRPTPLM